MSASSTGRSVLVVGRGSGVARATTRAVRAAGGEAVVAGRDRTVLESPKGCVAMFDGFEEFDISTADASIHGRRGGSGPTQLLLHRIP
jgi:NAD(P)-dependent dehydrogenase (short-subunit alcohol dehydrogenase family)